MKKIKIFYIFFISIILLNSTYSFKFYSLTYDELQNLINESIEIIKKNEIELALKYLLFISDNLNFNYNLNINKANLYSLIGFSYYRLKEYEKSIYYYELAANYLKDPKPAYKMIINILKKLKKIDFLKNYILKLENKYSETIEDYFFLASIYGINEDYYKALSYYRSILMLSPDNSSAYLGIANCYIELKEYLKSQRILNKLLFKYPKNEALLTTLAITYSKQKMYEKAYDLFKKVIDINPDYWPAYYNLACLYSLKGDRENSLKNFSLSALKGFRDFDKAMEDEDLKLIIDTPEFKKIKSKYESSIN